MYNHPFASQRFNQAKKHLSQLIPVLKSGDLFKFIKIIESEALTLHAMMMCSDPYFILMKPNTINIINEIWDFRNTTQIPVCFTLDAGANVHVLYPKSNALEVNKFIDNNLAKYCQDGQFINDHVGNGAEGSKFCYICLIKYFCTNERTFILKFYCLVSMVLSKIPKVFQFLTTTIKVH